jgi:hypothetical protein
MLIGSEHGCVCTAVLVLFLCQQLIPMLHDRTLHHTLNLGSQVIF